jgi:hypothetical protein
MHGAVALLLWRELQLGGIRERMCACRNAKEVIQTILEQDEDRSTLISCLLWRWWCRRNRINAKGEGWVV